MSAPAQLPFAVIAWIGRQAGGRVLDDGSWFGRLRCRALPGLDLCAAVLFAGLLFAAGALARFPGGPCPAGSTQFNRFLRSMVNMRGMYLNSHG